VKELDAISAASHIPREKLLKMTTKGADVIESGPNPKEPTRWLPLPCRLYPHSMSGDILAVHVDCAYGKDLFRNMIKELRKKSIDPEQLDKLLCSGKIDGRNQ
jgi:hypothetical protein